MGQEQTGSAAAHTPGPWRYISNPHGPDTIVSEAGDIVATFDGPPRSEDGELLAAAPALLEALRNLLSFSAVLSDEYLSAFENWPADREIQGWPKERWLRASAAKKEAIAAIAAATGGAQ
jgi:hypothetical protein